MEAAVKWYLFILIILGVNLSTFDKMIRVTMTSKAILPHNIVFVKISEPGIHL
jgi:hypothetical protein